MKHRMSYLVAWALLVPALLEWPSALGQASQPAPTSMPTVNYADSAFGFELQVPAGWDYDRSRFQQFKDSIGLMRGRGPGGRQGLQIMLFRIQPDVTPGTDPERKAVRLPSFEDWVVTFGKSLAENANTDRLEWETWKLPPRVGALLSYSSKIGAATTRTHCLCIPFDPSTVWVLVYSGTLLEPTDERQLRQDFDQLAGTLRVHYDPGEVEQLAAAFERGQALIERLHKQSSEVQLDEAEYYYDIAIAGKSIGYIRRRAAREEFVFSSPGAKYADSRPGLRVRERSWRFADDGTVRYTRLDMFSSFDAQNELIENKLTQIPAPDVQPQQLLIKTDQVIRKDDVLFSSFTTSLDRALPEPSKPLSVGPVYLDLAWVRVSPGLLLTAPKEPHAFAIYNTDTRSLVSETITPLGERELAGQAGKAYAFEVREGLIDRPSLMYTDRRGTLLRLVAGDLVVNRTTREEVERTYGRLRAEACQRFDLRDE